MKKRKKRQDYVLQDTYTLLSFDEMIVGLLYLKQADSSSFYILQTNMNLLQIYPAIHLVLSIIVFFFFFTKTIQATMRSFPGNVRSILSSMKLHIKIKKVPISQMCLQVLIL